jgi:Gas vesicle synthesis protein GvpL/GvpF
VLYVYAILDLPIAVDSLTGALHEPVTIVPGPACHVVVSEIAAASMPVPTADHLRAQDALIRALATRADAVLPARFGTSFEDETALRARLEHFTANRLRDALTRVRGCEQMTLRVFDANSATSAKVPAGTSPGIAYLTVRAAARASSLPALLEPLRHALAPLIRDEILGTSRRPPLVGSVYHLIARGDTARYRAVVDTHEPARGVTVRLTGPSPAYAFAKDALS